MASPKKPAVKKSETGHHVHHVHMKRPISRWWIFYTWMFGIFTFVVIGGAVTFVMDPTIIGDVDAKLGANVVAGQVNSFCVESLFKADDMVERDGYVYKRIKGSIVPIDIYFDGNYPETLSQELINRITILVPTAQVTKVDIRKSGSKGFQFNSLPYLVFDSKAQDSALYKQFAGQLEKQKGKLLLSGALVAPGIRSVLAQPEGSGLRIGSSEAAVKVTMYSDFDCPSCKDFFLTWYDRFNTDYIRSGKVLFILKNITQNASSKTLDAAKAVRCIGEQGRFDEIEKRIFNAPTALTLNDMKQHVRDMKLGTKEFELCMMTTEISNQVARDTADAVKLGISQLPTFVVNNRILSGESSYENLKSLIDSELLTIRNAGPEQKQASNMSDEPQLGSGSELIEYYFDYECASCGQVTAALRDLVKADPSVTVVFRNFPLDTHPYSLKAAVAAECANREGKFFDYHDTLLMSQDNLTERSLEQYARGLGLAGDFTTCVRSDITLPEVRDDIQTGSSRGISTVPSYIINGAKYEGAKTLDDLKAILAGD